MPNQVLLSKYLLSSIFCLTAWWIWALNSKQRSPVCSCQKRETSTSGVQACMPCFWKGKGIKSRAPRQWPRGREAWELIDTYSIVCIPQVCFLTDQPCFGNMGISSKLVYLKNCKANTGKSEQKYETSKGIQGPLWQPATDKKSLIFTAGRPEGPEG